MSDWKSALGALAGISSSVEDDVPTEPTPDRKRRVGVVYSTDSNFCYEMDEPDEAATLPKNQQRLRLSMERAGRGGKTVTLVRGFVGTQEDADALCKFLKQKCGVGGSAKDGEIVIQGDHRTRLLEILRSEGYTQTK